ncbi:hypothetical protein [Cognataquiflexum aquatile]|uniref:hypothetical protein n=1 Tax=Cognataquiflexum aquatile TaxID=2249427 RepID=UPI000DE9B5DD|nr:hypothetical protein [Cognataquiflexum aquatile]
MKKSHWPKRVNGFLVLGGGLYFLDEGSIWGFILHLYNLILPQTSPNLGNHHRSVRIPFRDIFSAGLEWEGSGGKDGSGGEVRVDRLEGYEVSKLEGWG